MLCPCRAVPVLCLCCAVLCCFSFPELAAGRQRSLLTCLPPPHAPPCAPAQAATGLDSGLKHALEFRAVIRHKASQLLQHLPLLQRRAAEAVAALQEGDQQRARECLARLGRLLGDVQEGCLVMALGASELYAKHVSGAGRGGARWLSGTASLEGTGKPTSLGLQAQRGALDTACSPAACKRGHPGGAAPAPAHCSCAPLSAPQVRDGLAAYALCGALLIGLVRSAEELRRLGSESRAPFLLCRCKGQKGRPPASPAQELGQSCCLQTREQGSFWDGANTCWGWCGRGALHCGIHKRLPSCPSIALPSLSLPSLPCHHAQP